MLWMLLMLPGNYDMISEPPVDEPEVVEVVEDASQEEAESPTDEEEISPEIMEAIASRVMEKMSEKAKFLTVADEETIRKIVREEIREALKELLPPKNTSQAVMPPNVSAEDKEDYEEADLRVVEPSSGEKQEEKKVVKQEESKPSCILYLYTMEGCAPCKRAYDELIKESGNYYALYIGKYPTTYRDGSPVQSYPSYELWKDGRCTKKWAGYTPISYIIDACTE